MAAGSAPWWSWSATVCAVAALSVALLAPFILYPLLRADDTEVLLAHAGRFSASSAIVVPGAWRVPRTPEMRRRGLPGRLSRAFTQRLDRAVRVAAETGIADIVFSGGNGDSVLARRWVVERFGAGPAASATAPHDDPTTIDGPLVVDAMLRVPAGEEEQGLRWPPHRPGAAAATAPFRVRLWIENRSTTTATNAVETAALLRNVTWAHDEPCIACGGGAAAERRSTTTASGAKQDQEALSALVVVSSPYHQARCRLFFGPFFNGSSSDGGDAEVSREARRLFFVGSAADEFENLVPADPAWIEARTVFNEEPDPTPAAEASCRRPECIFVRHPRWPLGAMLPKSALDAFQSYLASWRAFTNVARVTAWSTTVGAWTREVGALVVNLLQRKYGLGDLVHLR